jgi:hypothetical protein
MALVIVLLLCRSLVLSNAITTHEKLNNSSGEEMKLESEKI